MQVGNFERSLRHSVDMVLDGCHFAAGFDVVFDTNLLVVSRVSISFAQVLERYCRLYAVPSEEMSFEFI